MEERKFMVLEGETVLASEMTLHAALIFIKAYLDEYYNEKIPLTITEIPKESEEI